jgi:hypothetical protein
VTLVAAVATAPVLLSATAAYAAPGTLKVKAAGDDFSDMANNPKPGCSFYLAAYDLKNDAGETLDYVFNVQGGPNNGDEAGNPGAITIDRDSNPDDNKNAEDDGRTVLLDKSEHGLPDGQYKVTLTTSNGDKIKSKVFRVDCPGGGGGGNPTPSPTPGGGGGGGDDGENTGEGGQTGGGGGGGGGGDVGGVENPTDNGEPPVGGVATGGGGLAAGGDGAGTLPWAIAAGGGLLAAVGVRRFLR